MPEVKKVTGSRSLDKALTPVQVAEIVRHEGAIMLPTGMTIPQAIDLLRAHDEHLNQEVVLSREYDAFPYDGAAALQRVLTKIYGWVPARPTPGFFTEHPPALIAVEVELGRTEQIPWGRFALPGVEGVINTGYTQKAGRIVFQLSAKIVRRHEDELKKLFDAVREELKTHSIYRGKAIRIRFLNDHSELLDMPEVSFVPTDVQRSQLIYSRHLEASIETNLFTPIERARDCKLNGIPVKRGILLGGMYGTGKTLAAAVAARLAVDHGITYIYVPRADELSQAIAFARQYDDPACVIFCEDIDRVMAGERTTKMDDLLNIIDGIDGKRSNILVVLTTNFLGNINPALLRPGRLDAVIEITPPDAEAVTRLLRVYGGQAIAADADLTEAGRELDGQIPAVLSEVVKRAKLSELRRTPPGQLVTQIGSAALLESAKTMTAQLNLLKPPTNPEPQPTIESAMERAASKALTKLIVTSDETNRKARSIAAKLGVG